MWLIIIFTDCSKAMLLLWIIYIISVLFLLCFRRGFHAHLFIDALWSPAGKGLTSWLSFVMSNCEVVTFPLEWSFSFGGQFPDSWGVYGTPHLVKTQHKKFSCFFFFFFFFFVLLLLFFSSIFQIRTPWRNDRMRSCQEKEKKRFWVRCGA